jgi:4-cresol dehydrogenase (hydroxylating)
MTTCTRNENIYSAVEEFVNILGSNAVAADSEDIERYAFTLGLPPERHTDIAAIVTPSSAEQIQAVVVIANNHRVPLRPYMGGRYRAQGIPGTVIVDLQRMNRVLEIDDDCAYAVIEPGVSFFDLYEHLRAGGHSLMMPVPEIACGSVIDYVLAGGHVLQPCGTEVVLGNGTLVRTGIGALPASRAWHTCGPGSGPLSDGLFVQSDLGIVTRMGIWLKPRPERYLSCNVTCRHDHDLPRLIDTIRPFLLDGTISNHPVLSNLVSTAASVAGRHEWYPRNGVIPETELERIADETGIGRWNLRFALYGRHDVVEAQLATLAAAFGVIAHSRFSFREYDGAAPEQAIRAGDKSQAGIPEADLGETIQWSGGAGDYLALSTVARLAAPDVEAHYRLLRTSMERHGFDHHGMLVLSPRAAMHVCHIPFDQSQPAEVATAHDACKTILAQAAEAGYAPYGLNGRLMASVAAPFDFNDGVIGRLRASIREAVDPNGILGANASR